MSFLQVQDLLLSKHVFISPPNAVKLKALSSFSLHAKLNQHGLRFLPCFAVSKKSSDSNTDSQLSDEDKSSERTVPITKPQKKRRRGRRSEADAVEDFIRSSLDQTFVSIRSQNPEAFESVSEAKIMKEKDEFDEDDDGNDNDNDDDVGGGKEKEWVVEEECDHWPVDADVGWGIRASEYFEEHSIKNVVGEDGLEIDWEGELDDSWVKEINCLEWESIAFHPSPLIVLVFERYKRASDNWKILKELEGAFKVFWKAKDRLPPRAVKIDINIERDLAYALKVKEGPQLLFLRGSRILYREKEIRTTDELVHMIAYFYYNAKKPSWIDDKALSYKY